MLLKRPIVFRKRHARVRMNRSSVAPVVAPVLISATFEITDSAILTLGFDRAVSIAEIAPAAFTVAHHPSTQAFLGDTGELLDATTVQIVLNYDDACEAGDDVVMNAGPTNGIVSTDGELAWAGVTDLLLPFNT